jgi:hypothetical protein
MDPTLIIPSTFLPRSSKYKPKILELPRNRKTRYAENVYMLEKKRHKREPQRRLKAKPARPVPENEGPSRPLQPRIPGQTNPDRPTHTLQEDATVGKVKQCKTNQADSKNFNRWGALLSLSCHTHGGPWDPAGILGSATVVVDGVKVDHVGRCDEREGRIDIWMTSAVGADRLAPLKSVMWTPLLIDGMCPAIMFACIVHCSNHVTNLRDIISCYSSDPRRDRPTGIVKTPSQAALGRPSAMLL